MLGTHSRCLVTGGAGFIGSHLVAALLDRGCTVRVVDNLSTGRLSNLAGVGDRIEFVHGDLTNPDVATAAVRDMEVVFHLAALPSVPLSFDEPWRAHASNLDATVRLLDASLKQRVRRFVFSSSCAVYGDSPVLPKRETMAVAATSPYAAAKLGSEQYVLAFARAGKLHGVALRYFNVFGPRQDPLSPYSAAIPRFLAAVARDEPVTIYGDGEQTRDFVHVSNVVEANLLAATTPAASRNVINVGSGRQTSLNRLLDAIGDVTGVRPRRISAAKRAGDVRHSVADLSWAAAIIGYRPTMSLEDGLRDTWASFEAPTVESRA